MTIHDDARAAFEEVYDRELARYQGLLEIADAELVVLRADKATFVAEVERLSAEIERLKARIAELETVQSPTPVTPKVGALPLGEARYDLGTQPVIVSDSTSLQSAINSHTPGDTISMRGGTYKVSGFTDPFTKGKGAFTLQNYPGESVTVVPADGSARGFMIVKAPGVVLRGFKLDGFTGNWGGNYGTLLLADDASGDGSSASGTVLENMHITNSASFAVRAFGNRNRRLSGVTLRNTTLDGSKAKQLLSTDWTDGFLVESSILRNVNVAGVTFDNSEMAAWKDTVSTNLRANNVIVENAVNSVGIWLDQSCVDAKITNVDIKGKTQYGVHMELCGWCIVANVKISGDCKFAFYNKGSRNIRYWNNSFTGKAEVVFMDEQDDRAGKTNAGDSRQPFLSRGIDYFSRENEWVNNSSTETAATYARTMIYDDQAKSDARGIVKVVAGNLFPVRAPGSTASFSLGTPARRDYTVASANSLDPTKFYGNGAVSSQVQAQPLPSDIASAIGAKAGATGTGILRDDLG